MIVLESDFLRPSLVPPRRNTDVPSSVSKWSVLVCVVPTRHNGERHGKRSRPRLTQWENPLVSLRDAFKETRGLQLSVWEQSNAVREDTRV